MKRACSNNQECSATVAELKSACGATDSWAVLYFASASYDPAALSRAMRERRLRELGLPAPSCSCSRPSSSTAKLLREVYFPSTVRSTTLAVRSSSRQISVISEM